MDKNKFRALVITTGILIGGAIWRFLIGRTDAPTLVLSVAAVLLINFIFLYLQSAIKVKRKK